MHPPKNCKDWAELKAIRRWLDAGLQTTLLLLDWPSS